MIWSVILCHIKYHESNKPLILMKISKTTLQCPTPEWDHRAIFQYIIIELANEQLIGKYLLLSYHSRHNHQDKNFALVAERVKNIIFCEFFITENDSCGSIYWNLSAVFDKDFWRKSSLTFTYIDSVINHMHYIL